MVAPMDAEPLLGRLLERCTFPPAGTHVTVAVSGGADSLALLALAVAAGNRVTAVHVDHGLRDGSAAEADLVRLAADRFEAAFRAERVVVAPGPNLEARARSARSAALPPDVLTGHTADDQAETVLLNLMWGAGLDGLAAMRPQGHPILAVRRADTVAVCEALGLTPFRDPTNDDPSFRRNRVRHELLPLLGQIAARDVVPRIVQLAAHAREAADFLDAAAAAIDPADARQLASCPPVLARVAVRAWLRPIDDEAHPPEAATVERVLAVARLEAAATDCGGGWRVERTAGRLRLVPPASS